MNLLQKIIIVFALVSVTQIGNNVYSQNLLNSTDLSQYKVEQLTEGQINQIRTELAKNHTTIESIEPALLSKGMSPTSYSLLKSKLQSSTATSTSEEMLKATTPQVEAEHKKLNQGKINPSKIFGSEIFSSSSLTFEPNSNMPTPLNYILGPGDEMHIVIYGVQEFAVNVGVTKEGKISIPNIGQIYVAGMTLEAATTVIKNTCSKVFNTLSTKQSSISITLNKIRTIKITIIGSHKAGNYSVSSLSTVFNALHLAGGPDENGSYRNIELIRDNKVLQVIDIYRFILSGDQSQNIALKDNDIIRIPVYNCRVSIEGEVKKNGIFELKPGENFNDLLNYCAGFKESAYLSTIKLIQNTDKELKIVDLIKNEYHTYEPKSGDAFKVGTLLNRYENKISIKGAVFRPDDYSFVPGLRVVDLIEKADGLVEDALKNKAQIIRLREDFTKEIISIDLNKSLLGDADHNILLKKDDEMLVFSIFDIQDEFSVRIGGQIRKPGTYPFVENLKLFDVIYQAGGFTEIASKKIEISRAIKKDEITKEQKELTEIITVELMDLIDLNKQEALNKILMPNDLILIRQIPVYSLEKTIIVEGYVEFPGHYSIKNKDEKVLDIINRCGGLKSEANLEGIFIRRNEYIIPINYRKIAKRPSSIENIKPQPGDELIVLKYIPAIKIVGSVSLNTEIPYIQGKHSKHYISAAGGMSEKSWKKKIYLSYPDGTARATKHFLFIKIYPKVKPGSIIHIPSKPEKTKNVTEFVSIASVTTSMATMIAVLAKLFQ
jgi:protein involved in polysaccharide export with SLBB domain